MTASMWLAASILALLVGPGLHAAVRRVGSIVAAGFDGFMFVAVLGLVLADVVPEATASGGLWSLACLGLGVAIPALAEHKVGPRASHRVATVVALVGMALHASIDGMAIALAMPDDRVRAGGLALSIAIVLHRVPAGMAIWAMVGTGSGRARSVPVWVMSGVAVASIVGFSLARSGIFVDEPSSWGPFISFSSGLLLHVLGHAAVATHEGAEAGAGEDAGGSSDQRMRAARKRRSSGIGAALALVFVGIVQLDLLGWAGEIGHGHEHGHGHHDGAPSTVLVGLFATLAMTAAPAWVLAYFVAGVGRDWSLRFVSQLSRTRRESARLARCIEVFASLEAGGGMRQTRGLALAMGWVGIMTSFAWLGVGLASLRLALMALCVGMLCWAVARKSGPDRAERDTSCPDDPDPELSASPRLGGGWRALAFGFGPLLDASMPRLCVGMCFAAIIAPALAQTQLSNVDPVWSVVAAVAIGCFVHASAMGSTPLLAVALMHGATPGSVLALTLTAPMHALRFRVWDRPAQGRGREKWLLASMVVAMALASGWSIDWADSRFFAGELGRLAWYETGQPHSPGDFSVWSRLAALCLLVTGSASLLRQGPRGFLAQLWGGHDHDHGHGHDPVDGHGHAEHGHGTHRH